jgi:YVTN family beta-propeller protein
MPVAVAVNPLTNKVYVANRDSNNVTVIDGATNNTTTVAVGIQPFAVAVNPLTNKIYVANAAGGSVTVIDGATNNTTTVAVGALPSGVTVNPVTNKIYVANRDGNSLTVIDGATNTAITIPTGMAPIGVAVNPVTNKIYVANSGSNDVTVLTEQQVQPIPLTSKITPLVGNATGNSTPTFTFSASSSFAPIAPPVDALYFQFDTWGGPWAAAVSAGPPGSFSGTAPTLTQGVHILYAYATDGQDATSTMTTTWGGSSPLVGAIAPYLFVVAAPGFFLGPATGGSTSATVSAGHTATYDLQVSPFNGLTGAVQLTCSGAPTGAACSISPNPVTITGASPVPFMVDVTTMKSGIAPRFLPRAPGGAPAPLALVGLLSLLIVFGLRKRRRALVAAPALTLVLLILLAACGGSGQGGSGSGSSGTPPGTYTLKLTATAPGISHTIPLTLNVTP